MSFDPSHISKADAAAYSSSEDDADEDDSFDTRPSTDPRNDFHDFNPRKRRRTGRNAKESAALGIFGSDSDDDAPAPGRGWKSKKNLRHKNMTFVSAGQKDTAQEDEDEEDDDDEDDEADGRRPGLGSTRAPSAPENGADGYNINDSDQDEDEDEDEDQAPGLGLGFRPAAAQGLGWAQPTDSGQDAQQTPSKAPAFKSKYDGSTPLGKGFVPSSAREPVLKSGLKDEPAPSVSTPKPSAFGGGGGGAKAKSFAARMMAKMGYVEGQGLGAEGQGRNVIIEANLRPQGVGLGAVKEKSEHERKEEKRQARMRGEQVSDSEEEKKRKKKKQQKERKAQGLDSTPASAASTPRRPKTKYLTVNDVQKDAPGLHIPDAFAPILDLTGQDQKLLTSGSGLLTPGASTERPEHIEARKLARRAQGDLTAFVEEWKSLEERKKWLDGETKLRQQELDLIDSDLSNLRLFSSALEQVSEAARNHEWDPIMEALKKVEGASTSPDEDLAGIAVAAIHPFVRDAVQGWQPLEDPKLGNLSSDLCAIKGILGLNKQPGGKAVAKFADLELDGTHRHHQRSTTPYESMIYKHIFPKLVTAVSQTWDVYDAQPLLNIFERWDELFPTFVRSQLLEQVARRLDEAVAEWKPRKKQHNLPHLWLFPWLELLSRHLPHHIEPKGSGLVANVRRKFRQVIDVWEFDRGVVPGLKEWKAVFGDQWEALMRHHVLPSMGKYLRTRFRVDPADQEAHMGALDGVLKWARESGGSSSVGGGSGGGVISASTVLKVVVVEVFPKWHGVLYDWLTSPDANYEEIGQWYEWWKDSVFPEAMASHRLLVAEFEKGRTTIEAALDLGPDAAAQLPRPVPEADSRDHRHHRHKGAAKASHGSKATAPPQQQQQKQQKTEDKAERSFRDEIEEWCQHNDLQFIPVRKANDQGKHYFRITARMDGKGGVLAYFASGDVLAVESRKLNLNLSRDKKDDRGLLLEQLFEES